MHACDQLFAAATIGVYSFTRRSALALVFMVGNAVAVTVRRKSASAARANLCHLALRINNVNCYTPQILDQELPRGDLGDLYDPASGD